MGVLRALALLALGAACYSVQVEPCAVRCSPAGDCPSGTSCNASDGFCHASAGEPLCAPRDAAADAAGDAGPDAGGPSTQFEHLAVSLHHACGIRGDGTLWCWGLDVWGELGQGAAMLGTVYAPTQVVNPTGGAFSAVSTGLVHTCAIAEPDGTLYCWGAADVGQLGLDPLPAVPAAPTLSTRVQTAGGATGWVSVSCGYRHTCGIQRDSGGMQRAYCWGANWDGELGLDVDPSTDPMRDSPALVAGGFTDWSAIEAGDFHSCGIRAIDGGRLYCWGFDDVGQSGRPAMPSVIAPAEVDPAATGWIAVTGGTGHTCALRRDAADTRLYCFGYDGAQQLFAGAGDQSGHTPVEALGGYTDWAQVSAGQYHTCAIRGTMLLCVGANQDGRLGLGTTGGLEEPGVVAGSWRRVAAGIASTCAIDSAGGVSCFGNNDEGQLGSGAAGRKTVPARVGPDNDWTWVASGFRHTCGIRDNGRLFCWGANDSGELGHQGAMTGIDTEQTVSPVEADFDPTAQWSRVAVGSDHTCALKIDGSIWCWGSNYSGAVDEGTFLPALPPTRRGASSFVDVHAEDDISCGERDVTGALQAECWGAYGALTMPDGTPVELLAAGPGRACWITPSDTIACDPASADHETLEVGWRALTVGGLHACGIRDDDTLWCWGQNGYEQVGVPAPAVITTPTAVAPSQRFSSVDAGYYGTCAIDADTSGLYCWGSNNAGELGIGDDLDTHPPTEVAPGSQWLMVSAVGDHTCGIRTDGTLWCWGTNFIGQLGTGDGGRARPTPIAAP